MSKIVYYEDLFLEFYNIIFNSVGLMSFDIDDKDFSAVNSFYATLSQDREITAAQAAYIIRILEKYKLLSKSAGLDYMASLKTLTWKKPFRVLDLTKKISVEPYDNDTMAIFLKIPFSLKEKFEKEVQPRQGYGSGQWDHDKKVRILDPYNFNLVHLHEFCITHQVEVDESFIELLNQVEEIWQQQDSIIPHCFVEDEQIKISSLEESAIVYWEENKTGNKYKDLMLAKRMGLVYKNSKKSQSLTEKISESTNKLFWMFDNELFFKFYKEVEGVATVVLDRNTKNIQHWISNFVKSAEESGVSKDIIRVCFREPATAETDFNKWVKENNLGGKMEGGKIFIFLHKPSKWLFKDSVDVNIIVINSFTPVNEPSMQTWIESHHCVVYVGEMKPTPPRFEKFCRLVN
jgi:hypothetical protein